MALALRHFRCGSQRELRPALAVRLIEGLERAFVRKGSRLDTAFFMDAADDSTDP